MSIEGFESKGNEQSDPSEWIDFGTASVSRPAKGSDGKEKDVKRGAREYEYIEVLEDESLQEYRDASEAVSILHLTLGRIADVVNEDLMREIKDTFKKVRELVKVKKHERGYYAEEDDAIRYLVDKFGLSSSYEIDGIFIDFNVRRV